MKKIALFILAWIVIIVCNSWFIPIMYLWIGFDYLNTIAEKGLYDFLWFDEFQKVFPSDLDTQVLIFSVIIISILSLLGVPFLLKRWKSKRNVLDREIKIKEIEIKLLELSMQK